MNENLNEDNSWLKENESYLKNKKRRTKMAAIMIAAALFIGTAVFFFVKNSDERAYMYGIENYYDTLNKGSSYHNEFNAVEIEDDTEDYLSSIGITGYIQWTNILHKLDVRIMEEKYGDGFKVAYRIEKTEPLTEEELDDYRNTIATKADYDRAYRLNMKEHFKGPKGEGFEEQYIIVAHINGNGWRFQQERTVKINKEISFLETIREHYKRLNAISVSTDALDDYNYSEEVNAKYTKESSTLSEEYGDGFQVKHPLKDISPLSRKKLAELAELVGQDEDHFIKGYKVDLVENFTSDKGENTGENTCFVLYTSEDDFAVYGERWLDMSD